MKTTTFNTNGLENEDFRELTADQMAVVQGGWGTVVAFLGLMSTPKPQTGGGLLGFTTDLPL